MFQLFKPLTERQYMQRDIDHYKGYEKEMVDERNRLNIYIGANRMMIEQLENELESMK